MCKSNLSFYFDGTKSTSGQRFFEGLCRELESMGVSEYSGSSSIVLFNISAPLKEIAFARLRGKVVVLRVDGLYFDRLSPRFISTFSWPMRLVLKIGNAFSGWTTAFTHLANFVNQNWTSFLRIALASHIIYQSNYSRAVHKTYFPRKPSTIIVNGATYIDNPDIRRPEESCQAIQLVSIYDEWRPAKRMFDLVDFVVWANESKGVRVNITLLGYTGKFPDCCDSTFELLVQEKPYFRLLPRFQSLEGEIREALVNADMYVMFSFRDPCPNVVVEAMAHGLPVLGVTSGGLPDIVEDAGILVSDGDKEALFTSWRYDCDFPPINYEEALSAAQRIKSQARTYRQNVQRRFDTDLGMKVVAARYFRVLKSFS